MEHGQIYDLANPNSRILFWGAEMGPCPKLRESKQEVLRPMQKKNFFFNETDLISPIIHENN